MTAKQFRSIPPVQALLESQEAINLCDQYGRPETVDAIRIVLKSIRDRLRSDSTFTLPEFFNDSFFEDVRNVIKRNRERSLKQVINATGIVLHTNLGRAPLATDALELIAETARYYSNLEFDLDTGKRGSRYMHVENILKKITGAEAAIVVNNCAAAVLVCLDTFARGGEVIVSRGELIEIGGGFRMPDVIEATGAILREVGTTNKTRLADMESAINENTRIILSNHCSNFRITGFTESPGIREMAALAHANNLYMMLDLGSGAVIGLEQFGIYNERSVPQLLGDGVDVLMFSGDKLLGGPQAGIILGRKAAMDTIRKNPLLRALRIDKLSLAALEATCRLYQSPEIALQRIPILKMITEDQVSVRRKTTKLLRFINGLKTDALAASIEDSTAYVGGGSAPMNELPSCIIKLEFSKHTPEAVARTLRRHKPAIIGRIAGNAFVMDLRTVFPEQIPHIHSAIKSLI